MWYCCSGLCSSGGLSRVCCDGGCWLYVGLVFWCLLCW